jgi:hypothetical protein
LVTGADLAIVNGIGGIPVVAVQSGNVFPRSESNAARSTVSETRAWKIETPGGADAAMRKVYSEHVALTRSWFADLVLRGIYTSEEAAALQDPSGISTWVAPDDQQFGPVPIVARLGERLIAGVDLWQQKRDRYWFISDLIRDQAPQFKGVGRDLVEVAIMWWASRFARTGWGLRVFAMTPEAGAVKWWTDFLKRPADLTGESTKARGFVFGAVGWVLDPGKPMRDLLRP